MFMVYKFLLKVISCEFHYNTPMSTEIARRFYFDRYNCLNNDIIFR